MFFIIWKNVNGFQTLKAIKYIECVFYLMDEKSKYNRMPEKEQVDLHEEIKEEIIHVC